MLVFVKDLAIHFLKIGLNARNGDQSACQVARCPHGGQLPPVSAGFKSCKIGGIGQRSFSGNGKSRPDVVQVAGDGTGDGSGGGHIQLPGTGAQLDDGTVGIVSGFDADSSRDVQCRLPGPKGVDRHAQALG